VRFLYATAFALFSLAAAPVASPAQSLDPSLLSVLCSDDYYEDTAGLCSAPAPPEALPAVLTVEAIIEKYGVIVACDLNDVSVIALLADPDTSPVSSIHPRRKSSTAEKAIVTEDETSTDPSSEPATIPSPIVATETQPRQSDEAADEVTITGPPTGHLPVAGAGPPVDDKRTIE
jgi:hypothetical protein